MTEFEEYQEHTQYTHNAFCRIVIRHASIDAARKLYSKWKREISLEYLSEEKFMPFAATDEYFAQPPSSEEYAAYERNRLSLYREAAKEAESIIDRWEDELDDDEDYEPDEYFSD